MGCLEIGGSSRVARLCRRKATAFSSSSSARRRICTGTSILGRSASWPTSALLARRRRRLHMPPPPPAKRARFVLVIRPRELLFPPPSPPRKFARGETGSSGEEEQGKSDRPEEEESAGCKSVKRVMAPLQKTQLAGRAAPRLLPSHSGVAARFQGQSRGSLQGGHDGEGE
ncbi:uncharacterized protein PHA67_021989 isoform 1-T14 [Liasis olivaceus]